MDYLANCAGDEEEGRYHLNTMLSADVIRVCVSTAVYQYTSSKHYSTEIITRIIRSGIVYQLIDIVAVFELDSFCEFQVTNPSINYVELSESTSSQNKTNRRRLKK